MYGGFLPNLHPDSSRPTPQTPLTSALAQHKISLFFPNESISHKSPSQVCSCSPGTQHTAASSLFHCPTSRSRPRPRSYIRETHISSSLTRLQAALKAIRARPQGKTKNQQTTHHQTTEGHRHGTTTAQSHWVPPHGAGTAGSAPLCSQLPHKRTMHSKISQKKKRVWSTIWRVKHQ